MNEQPNDLSLPPPPRLCVSYLCDTTRIVPTGLLCTLSCDNPYQKDDVTCLGEAASCKWGTHS